LLLLTIDTTRADHLGCYGYPRATTPTLDRLSRRATLLSRVYTSAPDTVAAHSSLLTGLFPFVHHARNFGRPLARSYETLAERLRAAGYATAAFTSGFTLSRRHSRLDQGFETYVDFLGQPTGVHGALAPELRKRRQCRPADETNALVEQWLQEPPARPFFLWVHYFDPHAVYAPPAPYDAMFGYDPRDNHKQSVRCVDFRRLPLPDVIALYDGEIRFMDAQIERLLQRLDDQGLRENTVLAVMADHGEALGEHGFVGDHGRTLFLEEIHIPVLYTGPARLPQGRIVDTLSDMEDQLPTLLALLGRSPPSGIQGESLAPLLLRGEPRRRPPVAYSQMCTARDEPPAQISLVTEEEQLLLRPGEGAWRRCDLSADPAEHGCAPIPPTRARRILAAAGLDAARAFPIAVGDDYAEFCSRMRTLFGAEAPVDGPGNAIHLSEEEVETLEGLGYVR
jgi:arylsulfatase A-like enzyme